MKLGKAILVKRSQVIRSHGFVTETEEFEVRIMAIAEGWAMVRRKGAMPFVARLEDLSQ